MAFLLPINLHKVQWYDCDLKIVVILKHCFISCIHDIFSKYVKVCTLIISLDFPSSTSFKQKIIFLVSFMQTYQGKWAPWFKNALIFLLILLLQIPMVNFF